MYILFKSKSFYLIIYTFIVLLILINNSLKAEQEIRIISDQISIDKEKNIIHATGDVLILGEKIYSKSNDIMYEKNIGKIRSNGKIDFIDEHGNNYFLNDLITNDQFTEFNASSVKMRLKDESRLVGSKIVKRNNLNIISDAEYTPCIEENYLVENCPGWKMKASKVYHNLETKTVHYDHARIHIFNFPIFYLPYFAHPDPSVNKKTGFLMPTIKNDGQLGDIVSLPFFYNISGNRDLTLTPNFQSKGNNFLEVNYRHKNQLGIIDIDSSVNDNGDNLGTRNHFFLNADIENKHGSLHAYLQTSNNDTYMRKNNINNLTVLKSGIEFSRFKDDRSLLLKTLSYKHLTIQEGEQWEHVYPEIEYNISSIKDNYFDGNLSLNNNFSNYKSIDNSITILGSSQLNWTKSNTDKNIGLVFENSANTRIVALSKDFEGTIADEEKVLLFPQISSKIKYPLIKVNKNYAQTLSPIFMPILAPYNNYTEAQTINNTNVFSTNRATGLDKWESGPRINYGVEWFLDVNNKFDTKLTIAQSAKINKSKSDTSDEVSDYVVISKFNFAPNKYIDNSIILDRDKIDIKETNINAFFDYDKFRFAIDHDYTSSKYAIGSEQIRIGGNIMMNNDFSFNFTGTRDLNTNNNIGYQYGMLYENDCLGIDFNYYRDLTKDRDISESDGLSLTIVLKPFGSTKTYGSKKIFGPKV